MNDRRCSCFRSRARFTDFSSGNEGLESVSREKIEVHQSLQNFLQVGASVRRNSCTSVTDYTLEQIQSHLHIEQEQKIHAKLDSVTRVHYVEESSKPNKSYVTET